MSEMKELISFGTGFRKGFLGGTVDKKKKKHKKKKWPKD